MKIGFKLRQIFTDISNITRRAINIFNYLIWLIFDFSKFKKIAKENIKNVLVIFSGATGDTYNLLGILNQLTIKNPDIDIFYLGQENTRKFIKNPDIKVIDPNKTIKLISKRKIDALAFIDFPRNFPRKFHLKLLEVPYRVGCNEVSISLALKRWPIFLTRRIFPRYRSGIRDWIEVFEKLGFNIEDKPLFYFINQSEKDAKNFIRENNIKKSEKLVFFHPGAGTISKAKSENKVASHEWPEERWAELADKIIKNYGARVIFTGSPEEKKIISGIIKKIKYKKKVLDSSGKFSIEDLASLLKRGDLLISIDTSMAHIGAHSGIYVIDLFGPYPPKLALPWTDKKTLIFHKELCHGCRRYACPEGNAVCMEAISVKEVFQEARRILK